MSMEKQQKVWTGAAGGVLALALAAATLVAASTGGSSTRSADGPGVIASPNASQAADANDTVRNYILQHPDVSPTSPTPTPTVTPTDDPLPTPTFTTPQPTPTDDNPAAVHVSITATTAVIIWKKPTGGTPTGYIYGRNGGDSGGSGAYTSPVLPATTFTATLDKLLPGTDYIVFIQAVYPTGNKQVSTHITTPGAQPTTPAPTTSTSGPTAFRSGETWSSGVWNDQDPGATASFVAGPRGGRDVDNVLVYTSRSSIASENNPAAWRKALPVNFDGAQQDIVLGLTTWTGDGAFMDASAAAKIGASLCTVDGTHPIVRLDWEMNLSDGAGVNGAMLSAGNYTAWVARFRAVATALKAAPCGIRIDFNPNHGVDQTSGCNPGGIANMCTRRAFQALRDVVDIYGIDTYDSYPVTNSSGWAYRINPSSNNEMEQARAYAVANGKKFSVPEWGLACNTGGCQWQGNAGGDNGYYMTQMVGWFRAHSGDMAYETYFNEPNPYINSDLIAHNPNGRAAYRLALAA
jgi:hypothetical protein